MFQSSMARVDSHVSSNDARGIDRRPALRDLNAGVSHDELKRESAADSLEIPTNRADLRAVEVTMLDLRK